MVKRLGIIHSWNPGAGIATRERSNPGSYSREPSVSMTIVRNSYANITGKFRFANAVNAAISIGGGTWGERVTYAPHFIPTRLSSLGTYFKKLDDILRLAIQFKAKKRNNSEFVTLIEKNKCFDILILITSK